MCRVGDIRHISDIHFQIALTFEHVASFGLRSVQQAWRVDDKKKIDGRIAVKPKSADDYVGRPNNALPKS